MKWSEEPVKVELECASVEKENEEERRRRILARHWLDAFFFMETGARDASLRLNGRSANEISRQQHTHTHTHTQTHTNIVLNTNFWFFVFYPSISSNFMINDTLWCDVIEKASRRLMMMMMIIYVIIKFDIGVCNQHIRTICTAIFRWYQRKLMTK